MDVVIELVGLVAGVAFGVWAMRSRNVPWRRAWGLIMGVFGIAAGLSLAAWSLTRSGDLGCSDLGILVGFSSSSTVNGVCVGRWDAPAAHFVLSLVMMAGAALALFVVARPLMASAKPIHAKTASLLLLVAAGLTLSRLVVEVSQNQYNLLAVLPSIAFFILARDASSEMTGGS